MLSSPETQNGQGGCTKIHGNEADDFKLLGEAPEGRVVVDFNGDEFRVDVVE
jgi:hypothetical protein